MPIWVVTGRMWSPASPAIRKPIGDQLAGRLPFGQPRDRHADPQLGQELAQAGDQNLPAQNDRRAASKDQPRIVSSAASISRHDDTKQLVGDRIEHAAERGLLSPGAREIAVEDIGDAGGDEDASATQRGHTPPP